MKVWNLPLESIQSRYTCEWKWQFERVFKSEGLKFESLFGEKIKSKLQSKFFLDPINTNIWKLSQMLKLLKKCKFEKDDVIFIPDFWFPSVEVLSYIKHLADKKFKIVGIAHAGTYDCHDLTHQVGMQYFGKSLEEAWFSIFDKIFVATEFHKQMILNNRLVDKEKIKVTGLPVDVKGLAKYKSNQRGGTAFTGRKSVEKGYEEIRYLEREGMHINILLDFELSKKEYYKVLGHSSKVIAPSKQETFGYGIVEAMAMDVVPIVPDSLSFMEYVPKKYRYKNINEMNDMIYTIYTKQPNLSQYVKKFQYQKVIKDMIRCF